MGRRGHRVATVARGILFLLNLLLSPIPGRSYTIPGGWQPSRPSRDDAVADDDDKSGIVTGM